MSTYFSLSLFTAAMVCYGRCLIMPEAVRKLTSMLTTLLGLQDRGRIREGQVADLVLQLA